MRWLFERLWRSNDMCTVNIDGNDSRNEDEEYRKVGKTGE
jgi:hypothetical protein